MPLIVFSHGMGGSRRGYSYLGRYWAERGIASLMFTCRQRLVALGRQSFYVVDRLQRGAHESEALAGALDLRFALDRLLRGGGLMALRSIVGVCRGRHPYGANTALLAVGARVMREGQWVEARDPRFAAAM